MLFNSYIYLLLFLPIVFAGYFLFARLGAGAAVYWLVAASLFFYSFWNPIYLPLLLFSIAFNYVLGNVIRNDGYKRYIRKLTLIVGIIGNLALLGYFKYANFFVENINILFRSDITLQNVILPLAISFFTFQQIAYLVDSYKNIAYTRSFREYALFVSFFPQLISGPIVHHKEMMTQFREAKNTLINYKHVVIGLFILILGLSKKVVVADTFAVWANIGYDANTTLTLAEAWITSVSYTLQLYFDFSGYTDMAIGTAYMFNIKLPINFNSPYKALSIQDFWRRWHITLSRFLRDYLYIPLGGNQKGEFRTATNVFMVFLLGGLWHGAGWTFVIWGMLHGIASVIHLMWRKCRITLPVFVSWALTFLFVHVAWVFFRAESFDDALRVLTGMAGLSGIVGAPLFQTATTPIAFAALSLFAIHIPALVEIGIWTLIFLIVIVRMRNSMELAKRFVPNRRSFLIMITLLIISLLSLNRISEFIYFNF